MEKDYEVDDDIDRTSEGVYVPDDAYDLKPFDPKRKKKRAYVAPVYLEPQLYTYDEMLKMFYAKCPDAAIQTFKLPPPTLAIHGPHTCWMNFPKICAGLKREQAHVMGYVRTELGLKEMSITDRGLVYRGKTKERDLESLIKKYAAEYVTCRACRGINTRLERKNRLLFLMCTCGSKTRVDDI